MLRRRGRVSGGWRSLRTRTCAVAGGLALLVLLPACTADGRAGSGGTSAAPGAQQLDLPRVPWEGGPQYWERFPGTKAAGWTDPGFFPVVIWFDGISSDAEVEFDKAHGINTYVGVDPSTPYRLFADNDVYWIGEPMADGPADGGTNLVGYFLDDEIDGRITPPARGRAHLRERAAELDEDRFVYANYTYLVLAQDMPESDAGSFVNDFTDVVSVDMYWYTIPHCGQEPFRSPLILPIHRQTCRTASSYGTVVEALRQRDAADGKLQPVWQFVELLNGDGADAPFIRNIAPGEVRGAVMSSLINEARGIVYFNQSLNGTCQGGNVIRMAQMQEGFCGDVQVAAAGEVNAQIRELAPVLNTQSYVHTFGPGLDTMLKVHDGHAYVFAMVDESGPPGKREFTLPAGLRDGKVEVLFENRQVQARDGRFSDTFTDEYSYHVYRVPLSAEG